MRDSKQGFARAALARLAVLPSEQEEIKAVFDKGASQPRAYKGMKRYRAKRMMVGLSKGQFRMFSIMDR
jgi:hypothetical protein